MERALQIFVFDLKTLWFWMETQSFAEKRVIAGPDCMIVVIQSNLSLEEPLLRETSHDVTVLVKISLKCLFHFTLSIFFLHFNGRIWTCLMFRCWCKKLHMFKFAKLTCCAIFLLGCSARLQNNNCSLCNCAPDEDDKEQELPSWPKCVYKDNPIPFSLL